MNEAEQISKEFKELGIAIGKALYLDKIINKMNRETNWLKANIKPRLETYSCNIKKNKDCNKRICVCKYGPCKRVTNFKYAKRTPLNYIKRIINIIRGK